MNIHAPADLTIRIGLDTVGDTNTHTHTNTNASQSKASGTGRISDF